jgi:ketosteroid isomerase-like protein
MSEENVEIVRQYLAAYDNGGTDAWATFWHPEITWRAIEGAIDDVGIMHGADAIRRHYSQWEETFEDFRTEPDEVIDVGGDRVIAVVRSIGRMKGSEGELEIRYAVLFAIRDGKIARGREFASRAEAVKAADVQV